MYVAIKKVTDNIQCLENELDLVAIWRIKNPQTKRLHLKPKLTKVFYRLDYWLISNNLQRNFVESTVITPAIKTAIELVLKDSYQNVKGPGH